MTGPYNKTSQGSLRRLSFFKILLVIIFFQVKILRKNSLSRELKIRVVEFVLKKLSTFFEMLIVPHAPRCVDSYIFVFYLN